MKKQYIKPEAEWVSFRLTDVLTTSTTGELDKSVTVGDVTVGTEAGLFGSDLLPKV